MSDKIPIGGHYNELFHYYKFYILADPAFPHRNPVNSLVASMFPAMRPHILQTPEGELGLWIRHGKEESEVIMQYSGKTGTFRVEDYLPASVSVDKLSQFINDQLIPLVSEKGKEGFKDSVGRILANSEIHAGESRNVKKAWKEFIGRASRFYPHLKH